MSDSPINTAGVTPVPGPTTTSVAPIPAIAAVPKPVVSIAAGVNAALSKGIKPPASLTIHDSNDFKKQWFHGCIYSDTSARKTTTAALFRPPADTLIVLTRPVEQAIPLQGMGYTVITVTDAAALRFAIQFPEQLVPTWAKSPERTFILDDVTEAVNILLEDASTIDGREVKDRRRSYTAAGDELKELLKLAKSKQQHVILTATAKVRENPITNEERIGPDLPPSMLSFVLTELEFVFYIKTGTWMFVTDRERLAFKDTDDQGKEKTFIREIFAKHKLPLSVVKRVPPVIAGSEKMDLADIWRRVQSASAAPAVAKK